MTRLRLSLAFLALTAPLAAYAADDVLHLGAVVLDRPTVVTLGVQLLVTGDENTNAQVAVRYRAVGDPVWRAGLALFRVHPEDVHGRTVPRQFAGSLFDLVPATTYEIELHATDADGPVDQTLAVLATTRPVPAADPAHPTVRAVATATDLNDALAAAAPGDVIALADGTYDGQFAVFASGTTADPIVIRGTSTGGTILDAGGQEGNVLEVYGSFVHVERLTLRNATRGLRFQGAGAEGNVVRRVKIEDVILGIGSKADQKDFYLCDNSLAGRLVWPHVFSDDGGAFSDDDGIHVEGAGHVVCHNQIVGFGDAMKIGQAGSRAVDFYGNEVLSAYDNGLEFDLSEGNVRALRNRFTNNYSPLSFQPVYGGPVYAVRNVVVNIKDEPMKFHGLGGSPPQEPSGILVFHNTFVHPEFAGYLQTSATSHHFLIENNVFHGPNAVGPTGDALEWSGPIDDGLFDYNAWLPDGRFDFDAAGDWPSFAAMQAAGTFETHGVLLGAGTFASGLTAPPDYTVTMAPQDVTLAAASPAVDAALPLANLNDDFAGAGPDMGALERGCPLPLYGIRPDGVDETAAAAPCGATTTTASTSTTTTLPFTLIQTTSLVLADGTPAARKVVFKSTTRRDPIANRVVPAIPGTTGDPTLGGATLTVYNAGSGEVATVALPAFDPGTGSGWSVLGSPSRPRGYLFRRRGPTGAVSRVTVKADRLALKGGGAGWPFTLDEPSQGTLAVRLRLGSARPWCAAAPGAAGRDRPGSFVAVPRTPPPLVCPPLP